TRLLEHLEDAHPVPRVHRRRGVAIGPGADAPVELDVVAALQRDRLVAFLASDPPWRRLAEALVPGPHAVAQLRLLRVDPVAGEAACQTADAEARAAQRRDRACPPVRDLAAFVFQRDEH